MPAIAKPQRLSLTQHCLRSIQQYVADNNLGPGDKLPPMQEWSAQLGVSVVVVREAFQALQALGLVDIQHGRGIFVRGLKDTDFLDMIAFRHSLESLTLEETVEMRGMLDLAALENCIARASPEGIQRLEQLLQEMLDDPSIPGTYSAKHAAFHRAMLEVSGNRILVSIGVPLLNTFWGLGWRQEIQDAARDCEYDSEAIHAAFLDAIKNKDFSRTRELVDEHLMGLCSRYSVFPCGRACESIGMLSVLAAVGQ